jgi:hypothetical protein
LGADSATKKITDFYHQGLLALGLGFEAVSDTKRKPAPYQDHMLTWVLRPAALGPIQKPELYKMKIRLGILGKSI